MKLSCLDDRQKAAGRYADFTLNGECVNMDVLEANEEEGYVVLVAPEYREIKGRQLLCAIPEHGNPFGCRTRRLNGEVRIVPKAGEEQKFADRLAFGSPTDRLRARVEEWTAESESEGKLA